MANVLFYIALIFASLSLAEFSNDGYAADDTGGQLIATTTFADNSEPSDSGDDLPLLHSGQGVQYPRALPTAYAWLSQSPVSNSKRSVSIRAPPRSTLYYA